jgi:MinD superfamily P-loop ATPase
MFLDCDVESPNAHLFLKPEIESEERAGISVPVVDEEKCTHCGKCQAICEYHAIAVLENKVIIFDNLCHGCGGCTLVCPEGAITEKQHSIGIVKRGKVGKSITFVGGYFDVGEEISPPLIMAVKKHIGDNCITIIDAPPGTSCPMVESVVGSDFCLLVTEPTPFGLSDLMMAVECLRQIKIPFGVVLNRSNIGNASVEDYCRKERIPILMRIPYRKEIAVSYSNGVLLVDAFPEYRETFAKLVMGIEKHKEKA